jgi:hypothetical protein
MMAARRNSRKTPHWRDYILSYEYFRGDNGAGLGASHQTGWAGLIACVLNTFARLDSASLLKDSKAMVGKITRAQVAGE